MTQAAQAQEAVPAVSGSWLNSLRLFCVASCLLSGVGVYLESDALVVGVGLLLLYFLTLLSVRGPAPAGAARAARLLGLVVFFPTGVVFFAVLGELPDPGAEATLGAAVYFGLAAAAQLGLIISATKILVSLRARVPALWQRALVWLFASAYVLAFLAVVLIPLMTGSLDDQRREFREAATVATLRTINTCAWSFANQHPEQGFPTALAALGPAGSGCLEERFLDGEELDYGFNYLPGAPDDTGAIATYAVSARPLRYARGSRRSFFSDDSAIIRYTDQERAAGADDPSLD
jgi:type II secretory pathway pseudopilin PulG